MSRLLIDQGLSLIKSGSRIFIQGKNKRIFSILFCSKNIRLYST